MHNSHSHRAFSGTPPLVEASRAVQRAMNRLPAVSREKPDTIWAANTPLRRMGRACIMPTALGFIR